MLRPADQGQKRPFWGKAMRATTILSLGLFILWFIMNIIANAAAPHALPSFNPDSQAAFTDAIRTANFFQGLGSLCLIGALAMLAVTAYKNIMDKKTSKTIHGHSVEYSPGAAIATGGSTAATGSATVSSYGSNIRTSEGDDVNNNFDVVINHIANSRISEAQKRQAKLIVDHLRRNTESTARSDADAESYIKELAQILDKVGNISATVRFALNGIAKAFGISL